MELAQVMKELESYGSESTRKIYAKHGAPAENFGVKVGDMKKILKKTKKNQALAEALFATGNADAMYLGGLMADEKTIATETLEAWAQASRWYMVGEYAVAGAAAESPHGWALGLAWIEADDDHVSAIGWATLAGVLAISKDEHLDLASIGALLERIEGQLHEAPNRTRYTMNGFVIAAGSYVKDVFDQAKKVAEAVGKVSVDMGGTACKVPFAPDYLEKMATSNRVGKKRKAVRC